MTAPDGADFCRLLKGVMKAVRSQGDQDEMVEGFRANGGEQCESPR